MRDGTPTKNITGELWDKQVIFDNGGIAHACSWHDFLVLWDAVCELCEDCRENWRCLALTNKETGYMYSTASKYKGP